ncbi:MAG: hypothetical protein FWH28_02375 [Clostridiales bacterium]|nr:hypothetical protein [Clostridiales bacterium]
MKTDSVIRCLEAMDALLAALDPVDVERFISMIKRDTFDYTEWQRDQWNDMTIDEIFDKATEYERIIQAQAK